MHDSHPELPVDPDAPRPLHLRFSELCWVFAGGIAGTGARYLIEEAWPAGTTTWPWATFAINLTGALVLGGLIETLALLGADDGWRQRIRLFGGTGICGAYTTYSTFALEVTQLGRHDATLLALAYALTTVVVGILAAIAGIALAHRLLRRPGAVA